MESNSIRLCEPSPVFCDSGKRLYEGSFPAGEREPTEKLSLRMAEGRMLYHRTLDEQGNLLCFTIVSLASNFSFLAYMATDPTRRSGGVGSKHLQRLIELLKQRYPHHLGLFLEIEATDPGTVEISEEERTTRLRRLKFYQRHGARIMCEQAIYLTPSYSQPGKEWEGELLAIDFGGRICRHSVKDVIREIYTRFYHLPADHQLVRKVLRNFAECEAKCESCDAHCDHPQHTETGGTGLIGLLRRFGQWLSSLLARATQWLSS